MFTWHHNPQDYTSWGLIISRKDKDLSTRSYRDCEGLKATNKPQKNMATVTVSLRDDSYTKKDGTLALYCTIYAGGKRIRVPVGVSVEPRNWDGKNQKVRGTSSEARDSNLIIRDVKARVNDILVRFRLEHRDITKEEFIREYSSPGRHKSFWDFMADELNSRRDLISQNTYRSQFSTLVKLKEAVGELPFKNLTEDTLKDIKRILAKNYGNNPNTVAKNLITLKTYVRIALRKKYISSNPFDVEKIKRVRPNQVWLTEEELKRMIDAYSRGLFQSNLHAVLQYFLFSCFTGMRLSDVKAFEMEQVKGEFIIVNPAKTKRTSNEIVSIPITKPVRMLLTDAARHRVRGRVFECYADQVTNRMLKRIADYLNISKPISFHSARHTFASIFLERTDDLATLQKLLGHSDIKQTMVYVHMTERKKVEQMQRCWDQWV